ncbi:Phloem protein 2-like protein [Cynara cardunculus var. scolymus]|uniref:Phloem protein 2-like protein n=1 Tax=Cynara cardunculus var. scolymus TaxID=59895 RepID=A0A118JH25_CYNCS|nr:Phloem protein 2-like protein [Cynara cardunculus var. scolymus]
MDMDIEVEVVMVVVVVDVEFTSHERDFDLEILVDGTQIPFDTLVVEGIEFQPSERWFFLAKNGKKCLFLTARAHLVTDRWKFESLPNLRFKEVAFDCYSSHFIISGQIKFQMLSPETTYACNLVYKITGDVDKIEGPIEVRNWNLPFSDSNSNGISYRYIYLLSPQLPVIRPNVDENTHNPLISQMPKFEGLPRLRNDGWMEVEIWEFETSIRVDKFEINFLLQRKSGSGFKGISVQGIEVKPERSSSFMINCKQK